MSVSVSRGSLVEYLERQSETVPSGIGASGDGLCLLVGETAIRNLRSALVTRGTDPDRVASFTTIQGLARRVLRHRSLNEPRVLNERVRETLLADVVDDASEGAVPDPLADLLARVGTAWDDDLLETLDTEFEQYLRASDAGADHDLLADAASQIDDPYGAHRTERTLAGFRALHAVLQERMAPLPDPVYLSESHLDREARTELAAHWNSLYPDVDWVAVGSIKVLDNTTLRFLEALADLPDGPSVHCFFNAGTADRHRERFERIGVDLESPPETGGDRPGIVDDLVETAETGRAHDDLPGETLSFVDAPDRRRELEQVARRVDDLVRDRDGDGPALGEILLVVREAAPYESVVEDVFSTHGIPYHVESERPAAQVIAYRLLKATVDLVAAAASDERVGYELLADPLRLGFCPVSAAPGDWPVDDATFLELEERLHAVQEGRAKEQEGRAEGQEGRADDPGAKRGERTVDAWKRLVDDRAARDGGAWRQLRTLLDWVVEQAARPPESGDDLQARLQAVLDAHRSQTSNDPVHATGGPCVDTTRLDVIEKHASHLAEQVAGELPGVGRYVDYVDDLSLAEPGWELGAEALGRVLGQEQYTVPNRDGNAVRLVIPANTYFLDAEHTFLVGAGADEFPAQPPRPTFFHEAFGEAVWEYAVDGPPEAAYLYFPGKEAQYRQEFDDYEATVSTAESGLTVARHYRTADGDQVAWSPFVDAIASTLSEDDPAYDRLRLGQWLPGPEWHGSWTATATEAPMRDRLRLAVYHLQSALDDGQYVPRLSGERPGDEASLLHLVLNADGAAFESEVVPRNERFRSPPTSITVDGTESVGRADAPADSAGTSLDDLVGDPVRPHEVDLYGQCELKYYFYQHLLVGGGVTGGRDGWPTYDSPYARELYPSIPKVLESHHAPPASRESMRRLVEHHLPDRQADLGAYDGVAALRADFEEWVAADDALSPAAFQTLVGEYLTVQQELSQGVERGWAWTDETDVEFDAGTVRLPGHRRDSIAELDDPVPVFQSGRPGGARAALKHCWRPGANDIMGGRCSDVCASCAAQDRCSIPTKHVLDTRVRASTVGDETSGSLILDRYRSSPSGRQGFYLSGETVATVPHEREVERYGTGNWDLRRRVWQDDVETLLDGMSPDADGSISYEVDREFVRNGGCEGCVYRNLCQVPHRLEAGGGDA